MLVAFARHEFALSRQMPDGTTEREHLIAAQRMTGRVFEELVSPPMLDWVRYIWTWFCELSRGRQSVFGPSPLAWSEVYGWSRLTGRRPTPWELHCLLAMDHEWVKANQPRKGKAK